jgi:hypothetical protein
VQVAPGAPPTLHFGAVDADAGPDASVSPGRPEWRFYTGIGAAGLGFAALAVSGGAFGAIAGYQEDPGFNRYRAGLAPDERACDAADADVVVQGGSKPSRVRAICGNADAWYAAGVTNAVFGSLLVAGGAALVVTSPMVWPLLTGKKAPWSGRTDVVPLVGEGLGGLLVSGKF